jgi:hypothetical protein
VQQHDASLGLGQRIEELQHPLVLDLVEGQVSSVAIAEVRELANGFRVDVDGPVPAQTPALIEQAAMRDHEEPSPERFLGPLEGIEVAEHSNEDF